MSPPAFRPRATPARRREKSRSTAGEALIYAPEAGIRSRLQRCLVRRGFRVTGVRSLHQAQELLEIGIRFQWIGLDLDPSPASALALLDAVREGAADTPVVGIGCQAEAGPVLEFFRRGGSGFLCKPLEERDLETVLPPLARSVPERAPGALAAAGENATTGLFSGAMAEVMKVAERIAASDAPVLLQGETGVGKGVVARTIHARSPRSQGPFVTVLCTAVPRNLLESELFGHAQGAFTGAHSDKPGKFELAHQGTIFLDEIGDLPFELQAKLLEVLDAGEFSRVGCNRQRQVDVHVVCATHHDLQRQVERGSFRADLYHRINVVSLRIPPLRERRDEILPLVRRFARTFAEELGRPTPQPSERLTGLLLGHSYPGNVRELENLVKRLVLFQDEERVFREILASRERAVASSFRRLLEEAERTAGQVPLLEVGRRAAIEIEHEFIDRALVSASWNRRRAARMLGVSYATLLQKIHELGIER